MPYRLHIASHARALPGVDTAWDSLHTFLRIPAGAVLAAMALGDVSLPAQLAAGLIGGTLTAATHATKAGARVMINGNDGSAAEGCR